MGESGSPRQQADWDWSWVCVCGTEGSWFCVRLRRGAFYWSSCCIWLVNTDVPKLGSNTLTKTQNGRKLKSNPTFHAWRTLGSVYGPSDCFPPFTVTFPPHYLNIPPFLCPSELPSFSLHGGLLLPFQSPTNSPWPSPPLAAFTPPPLHYPSPQPLISLPSMCLPFTKFHSEEPSRTNE